MEGSIYGQKAIFQGFRCAEMKKHSEFRARKEKSRQFSACSQLTAVQKIQ